MFSTVILSVIACTGCTAFVAEEYVGEGYSGAAPIEGIHDMRVAVPVPLGLSSQPKRVDVLSQPLEDAQNDIERALHTLSEYGVSIPPAYNDVKDTELYFVASPFNERFRSTTMLSGFRTDPLDLQQWSSSAALMRLRGQLAAQRLAYGAQDPQRYEAELSFSAPGAVTGFSFDIGLVPSASFAQEGGFSTRRLGAEFRLGQDIDQRGNAYGLPSWYFFAGADGEALIFNNTTAGTGLGLVNGLQLRDQVTVGDIQAGLNVRHFGTNFAANYIRREVEYELNFERVRRNEDFGGITLSWRR